MNWRIRSQEFLKWSGFLMSSLLILAIAFSSHP
jgi:hypothetical protein